MVGALAALLSKATHREMIAVVNDAYYMPEYSSCPRLGREFHENRDASSVNRPRVSILSTTNRQRRQNEFGAGPFFPSPCFMAGNICKLPWLSLSSQGWDQGNVDVFGYICADTWVQGICHNQTILHQHPPPHKLSNGRVSRNQPILFGSSRDCKGSWVHSR